MTLRIAAAMRAFGLFIVLSLLALGATSFYALNHVRIGGHAYRELADIKDLTADVLPPPLYLVEAHLTAMELAANSESLPEGRAKLAALHRDFDTRMAFWRSRKVETGIAAILFEDSDKAAKRFWSAAETELLPAVAAGDAAAVQAASKHIDAAYGDQRDAIDRVVPLLSAETDRVEAAAAKAVAFNRALLAAIGVLVGGLVVVSLQALMRRIVTPVEAISRYMGRLAEGDYDAAVPFADRGDELGDMARSVEVFRQAALERQSARLEQESERQAAERSRVQNEAERRAAEAERATVVAALADALARVAGGELTIRLSTPFPAEYESLRSDFNHAVAALDDLISGIGGATAGVDSGSTEIAHAADDLARRTETQAASLEETAAALDELTATVKQTASGAQEARQFVASARSSAHTSTEVVAQTVTAMSQIADSSKRITQIVGVIDEIAFQTNLLALNAGVEAARAGESGRGFAVVASEVRALAQRSADAAKEIKALIAESTDHVQSGVGLVNETGKALAQIVEQVAHIDTLVGGISSAAQEQANGLAEVNVAVNRMDQMTQQNAAMVEQTTAAAHAMRSSATELASQTQAFRTSGAQGGSATPARPAPQKASAGSRGARGQFPRVVGATALKVEEDGWEEF
jgi:methyl-accepting chemotaxis protein